MRQAHLSYAGPETRAIGGVGEFGPNKEPCAVSDDIAAQYSHPDAQAAGWHVTYHTADTPPSPEPDDE